VLLIVLDLMVFVEIVFLNVARIVMMAMQLQQIHVMHARLRSVVTASSKHQTVWVRMSSVMMGMQSILIHAILVY